MHIFGNKDAAELAGRLERVRAKYYGEQAAAGALSWAAATVCLFTAAVLLEHVFALPSAARTAIVAAGFALTLALFSWLVVFPLLRKFRVIGGGMTADDAALMVGGRFPAIGDHLRNLMQLARESRTGELYSSPLVAASLSDFSEKSRTLDFSTVVSSSRIRFISRVALAVVAGALLVFLFPGSGARGAAYRLAHFQREFTPPAPFLISLTPGDLRVVRNESVSISARLLPAPQAIRLAGALPQELSLVLEHEGVSTPETIVLRADTMGVFHYVSPSLRQGFTYTAASGEVRSETYKVEVADRPFIRSFTMRVAPPRYARLAELKLEENTGDAQALAGSHVRWQVTPSKEVASGAIVLDGGRRIALVQEGGMLQAGMTLAATTGYRILLEDASGVQNENPIHYTLTAQADQAPAIAILVPGKNIDIVENMSVPLQIRIADDYGFTSLRLFYRLVHSKYEKPQETFASITIPLASQTEKEQIVSYLWNASPLRLVPEDVVEYHAEVTDNDAVTGPKTAKSESYLLRLPSMEEVFAEADKSQTDAVRTLDESLKQAEDLKKDLDELDRDVKKNQASDWQKQKKADELLKQYSDMQKKLDDVSRQMDAMTQDLQKNNLLSPETLKKYAELQKLMREMNSPEFQNALKKLQEAMKSANADQLRKAMQDVQFSEESFRNSIERTMNLLKRIKVEQKTDELVKRAAELKANQDELQKETSRLSEEQKDQQADKLAKKQDDLSNDLSDLQKELSGLKENMEELGKQMPMEKMKKAEASANDQAMKEAMKQSSRQLKSGQKQQAMQSQQKAGQSMQQLSQNLTEMQEQLLANQLAEAMNGLRKAMDDMLTVSQKQEQLKNQSMKLDPNSPQFRDNAERQMSLQSDLSQISNGLAELSQQSFVVTPEMGKALGRAMSQMNTSLSSLEQRSGQQAAGSQGEAMASLNQGAAIVQNAMKDLQQGGGGSGGSLLQQLQRLSAQQQGINSQTQQLGQGKPGELSPQQLAQMGRLAAEQQAVQKSMEQLNREAQTSPDRNRILGDLKKIADEMKEVVQNLRQQADAEQTQQKQDRILSRMLNAQRSLRERDYEEQRKATTGRSMPLAKSPAELRKEAEPSGLQRDLQRAAESGYSKEYMDLIRRYYEAIQNQK